MSDTRPTAVPGGLRRRARRGAAAIVLAALASCTGGDGAAPIREAAPATPVDAVRQLVGDLRRNDLAAYARHALPPELHARMEAAWREGRTLWPLTELPLDDRLATILATLSAPDAEKALLRQFRRELASADRDLRSAASTLGMFVGQYVQAEPRYGVEERAHYGALVRALTDWGRRAPLGDLERARVAIPQLVAGARLTGLKGPDAFRQAGMERSLRRLGPFVARLKAVLVPYGLDLDAALDSAQVAPLDQAGDRARVRVRYVLAGTPVEAVVRLERRDGAWRLSDLLRHAEAEAGVADAAPQAVAGATPPPDVAGPAAPAAR